MCAHLWILFLFFRAVLGKNYTKQECITVGCVPSAAVAVSRGGGGVPGPGELYLVPGGVVYLPGGCTWSRGVYLVLGVYLVWGEGGIQSRGGVPCPRGAPGSGGVYLVPEGDVPGQVLPHCGQTHACINITFATSLRKVIIIFSVGAIIW